MVLYQHSNILRVKDDTQGQIPCRLRDVKRAIQAQIKIIKQVQNNNSFNLTETTPVNISTIIINNLEAYELLKQNEYGNELNRYLIKRDTFLEATTDTQKLFLSNLGVNYESYNNNVVN